jgi:hypothetical protein
LRWNDADPTVPNLQNPVLVFGIQPKQKRMQAAGEIKMDDHIFKAKITFEMYVSGKTKEDAYEKMLSIDKHKVMDKAQRTQIDIEDEPYEVLE